MGAAEPGPPGPTVTVPAAAALAAGTVTAGSLADGHGTVTVRGAGGLRGGSAPRRAAGEEFDDPSSHRVTPRLRCSEHLES